MSDYLPEEVLIEIFSRLPVKKLLQCRCLSKSWRSLISSESFVSLHLNKANTTKNNDPLLLLSYCSSKGPDSEPKEHYFLYKDEGFPDFCVDELVCPFQSISAYYCNVVGSCNGVFCLVDDVSNCTDRAVLWNPSIRKTVTIPEPLLASKSVRPFMQRFGFGYDSITNDYKLVRLSYSTDFRFGVVSPLAGVYSLKRGCWRMVSNDLKDVFIPRGSSSAFVNGACHWVAPTQLILSFVLKDEVFEKIEVPESISYANVAVFDGLLSLVAFNRIRSVASCAVWVMKEYGNVASWTKLFNIDHAVGIRSLCAFRNDGKVLFVMHDGKLVSYDPKTENSWSCDLGNNEDFFFVESYYLDPFMESLVLLTEANGDSN